METTVEKLNRIAGIESGANQTIRELKAEQRDLLQMALSYLPPDLLQRYNEIDDITDNLRADADKTIAELKEQVKLEVIQAGATVKGSFIEARFVNGRESWDGKSLIGYAAAHPEILVFRTVGEPSVSFYNRVAK